MEKAMLDLLAGEFDRPDVTAVYVTRLALERGFGPNATANHLRIALPAGYRVHEESGGAASVTKV